jgi:hypothetical protein
MCVSLLTPQHGTHPLWLHLLVNAPFLFGPLYAVLIYVVSALAVSAPGSFLARLHVVRTWLAIVVN